MRLVDNWKQAYKWASVQLSAGFAALFAFGPDLLSAWGLLPDDLKTALPEGTARIVSVTAFMLVIISRLLKKRD